MFVIGAMSSSLMSSVSYHELLTHRPASGGNLRKRPTGYFGLLRWELRPDYTRYDSSNGFIVKGSEFGTLHIFWRILYKLTAKFKLDVHRELLTHVLPLGTANRK